MPLIKGEKFGIQYSHNINFSSYVEYMRTLINNKFELVNSKESLIPHKLSMNYRTRDHLDTGCGNSPLH